MITSGTTTTRPKRRILLAAGSAALAGAVVAFATSVTLARFQSNHVTVTNTFAAGTVTLTTSAGGTCTASNVLPGTTPPGCTLQETYTGSLSAYLGVDVLVATKAQSPGNLALYNPSDSTKDLQITVADNQGAPVTYVSPSTNFGTALGSCPAGSGFDVTYTCYQLTNLLVSTTPFTSSSTAVTFTTTVSLPSNNPTGYQHGTASIVLKVHATQSRNQTLGACTAGSSCAGLTWS